ncbi:MAG: hypothetical protein RSE54_04040 [Ruthenibacterium sp.]
MAQRYGQTERAVNPHNTSKKERTITMKINPSLQFITEVRETSDMKEVAHLLSSGNWIAFCATTESPIVFGLGKVGKFDVSIALEPSKAVGDI